MGKEEYLLKLSMMEQEANKIEEQIKIVNQQVAELESLKLSVKKIDGSEKEILAPLGKGIFVKSDIKDKNLFVNIGAGVVVKKKPEEVIGLIDRQLDELNNIREELVNALEGVNAGVQELVEQARKERD